jgi:hypothetical protein
VCVCVRVFVCSCKERGRWYWRPSIKPTDQDSVLVPNVLKMSMCRQDVQLPCRLLA